MKTAAPQRVNLGVQLMFGLTILAAVVALVAGIVIHEAERSYLSDLVREEKAKIFELIMSSTLDDVISEDLPEIETIMRHVIAQDPELISVNIANEAGQHLFQWQRDQENTAVTSFVPWESEQYGLSLSKPIEWAGEAFGRITVAWDVSKSIDEVARHTLLIVLTVGGVCALLSVLVYLFLNAFAIRPIDQIAGRVIEFRRGIYGRSVALPKFASQEMEHLDDSVDSLGRFLTKREQREAELRQAKESAESANRAKTAFLANMSHELRTPLNAINGFSEMMAGEIFGSLGDHRYREYAEQINFSGNHLLALINDILDISKVEAGKGQLQMDTVDLKQLIAAAADLVREPAKQDEIELRVQIASDLPIIRADGRRVRQVLLNLLSNAVKFTPAGGEVAIEARWDTQTGIAVSVTDTGIGIAADKLDTALEAFGQAENAYTRKYEGTGLGLPLAKALIELHGGTLTLESRINVGTTARFTLPPDLAVAPAADPAGDQPAAAG